MSRLITKESIKNLVSDYDEGKSLLIKASDLLNGVMIKFNIFPAELSNIRGFLKNSDESNFYKYEVISEAQLRVLRRHPDCSNSEAVDLFCEELIKKRRS